MFPARSHRLVRQLQQRVAERKALVAEGDDASGLGSADGLERRGPQALLHLTGEKLKQRPQSSSVPLVGRVFGHLPDRGVRFRAGELGKGGLKLSDRKLRGKAGMVLILEASQSGEVGLDAVSEGGDGEIHGMALRASGSAQTADPWCRRARGGSRNRSPHCLT